MTTTAGRDSAPSSAARKPGHWITEWNPEDGTFWAARGSRVARRNLVCSIFTEHVGFAVWSLWSVFVLFLSPAYGISPDPKIAAAQKFLLIALPTALGAGVRLPYTAAVARLGGGNCTFISAAPLLGPTVTPAITLHPGTSYRTLLVTAVLAGVGRGQLLSVAPGVAVRVGPLRLVGKPVTALDDGLDDARFSQRGAEPAHSHLPSLLPSPPTPAAP